MNDSEVKDSFIESQFKNSLDELLAYNANYGAGILFLKLVLSFIALGIAKPSMDYHAATEKLFYYLRKHDPSAHAAMMKLANSVPERSRQR